MPLDATKNEPRATVQAWRHAKPTVTLYISYGGVATHMDLTIEEALRLGETLVECATEPGPRVGSAADLGCEVL